MKLTQNQKTELIIIALAITARFVYFWFSFESHGYDLIDTIHKGENYPEIANNILAGRGFSGATAEPFIPESWRTPLYPLFIAGILKIFETYWAVIIIQIALGGLIPILTKRLSQRLFTNDRIAVGVGIFFAVEPVLVWLSGILLTETLFITLFLGFALVFLKYLDNTGFGFLATSAAMLGLATLTRPVTQYLPIFIIFLMIWISRKKFSLKSAYHIIGFLALFLIVLSPWLYRNVKVFGTPSLAATKAVNLYVYFVPSILAIEKNIGYNEARQIFFTEENVDDLSVIDLRTADKFSNRSLEIMRQHPYGAMKLAALTTISFLTHDGYLDVLQDVGRLKTGLPGLPVFKLIQSPRQALQITGDLIKSPGIVIIIGRMLWIILSLSAAVGITMYIKRNGWRQEKIFFSLLILAYFVLTAAVVGFGITARYRMPINVFMVPFAFYAISRLRLPPKNTQAK